MSRDRVCDTHGAEDLELCLMALFHDSQLAEHNACPPSIQQTPFAETRWPPCFSPAFPASMRAGLDPAWPRAKATMRCVIVLVSWYRLIVFQYRGTSILRHR
jgi:hypothetical protein